MGSYSGTGRLLGLAACIGCGSVMQEDAETTGNGATGSGGTSEGTDAGVTGSDTGSGLPMGVQAAAEAACAVRDELPAIVPPPAEGGQTVVDWETLPVRVLPNVATKPDVWPETGLWWFLLPKLDWKPWAAVTDGGAPGLYLVGKDIENVAFAGGCETTGEGAPGSPFLETVRWDVSEVCPELPTVWAPDFAPPTEDECQYTARNLGLNETSDAPELIFVEVQ